MGMGPVGLGIVGLIVLAAVVALGVLAVVYLFVPLCRGIAAFARHIFKFVGGVVMDGLRFIGAVLTSIVYILLSLANLVLGRWQTAQHYGDAILDELHTVAIMVYRVVVGRPLRLIGLGTLVEGLETRMPQVIANAPAQDQNRRTPQFPGYEVVGTLQAGGSGARLYVAKPDQRRLLAFARDGFKDVNNVVIKAFSLREGSELPQIIRESRSLDAAKRLGLVLDHEFTNERFLYVTRYVPGQQLSMVTQQLHLQSGPDGLETEQLRTALTLIADLLRTLDTYHSGGLWHKDVKPDNIIVTGTGSHASAHLVDLGLITPLRSAMTLTTHGTEYFRDPDLVRMALKGVKVQDIDGTRFDVYAAGAVLYSVAENSFPAHGVLSRLSKKTPDALRWIIQRAMTDYDKRYVSAAAMFADIQALLAAEDMWAFKPMSLPSMNGEAAPAIPVAIAQLPAAVPTHFPDTALSPVQNGRTNATTELLFRMKLATSQGRYKGVLVAVGVFVLIVCIGAAALVSDEQPRTMHASSNNAAIRLSSDAQRAMENSQPADPVPPPAKRGPVFDTPEANAEAFGDSMDKSFDAVDSVVLRFGQAFTGFAGLFAEGGGTDGTFDRFKRDLALAMRTGNKRGNVAVVVDLPQPLSDKAQAAASLPLLGVLKSQLAITGDVRYLPLANFSTPEDDAVAERMKKACDGGDVASEDVKAILAKWLVTEPLLDAAVWVREKDAHEGQICSVESINDLEFIVISPEMDLLDSVRRARALSAVRRLVASLAAVKDAVDGAK